MRSLDNILCDSTIRPTMLSQVVPFDNHHDKGIELLMFIHNTQEVSRISLSKYLDFIEPLYNAQNESHTAKTYFKAG